MSLFDSPRASAIVTVFPETWGRDGDGNRVRVPSGTGTEVAGHFVYDASTEDTAEGQQATDAGRFHTRAWPTGFAGQVDMDGRRWDVVGDPQPHGGSRMTAHVVVRLRSRTPRGV